jgi:SagB-type dehydrogenase family enzyme
MSTLTKLALGMMGQLRPRPAAVDGQQTITLPAPVTSGGIPLFDALRQRQSTRDFAPDVIPRQTLSNLLWAGFGINRQDDGGRTAPSAMNGQEIDIYAAMSSGLYKYEPNSHSLAMTAAEDVRRVTGYQDFVDDAPLDLIYVVDHKRMQMVPATTRVTYASVCAGAITQNIYLYCASAGLATVIRAWIDRDALTHAMSLSTDHQVLLAQTVGFPKAKSSLTH